MNEANITQVHGTPQDFKDSIIADVRIEILKLRDNYIAKEAVEYLTRPEVCKIFKIALSTVSEWDKRGILKPYRIGNLVRYKSNEVNEALIAINKK